ncbi:hypothetical protein BT69DRAFT_1318643 [Atractiella rhizophila]|nr:hypothetical protein BT69DRAFT_1318643 [Atractiella rhizophila]
MSRKEEKESPTALLVSATEAFTYLLNDDLPTAKSTLLSSPSSPFHTCALGLLSFIEASLGGEDKDLSTALDLLFKAEESARKWKGKEEGEYWWAKGTTWEVLQADAVVCQGCTHIMTESYVEFMKAVYKLNRAYKIFHSSFKSVFPTGISEDDSIPTIIASLNTLYSANEIKQREKREKAANGNGSYYSLLSGWGRKSSSPSITQVNGSSTPKSNHGGITPRKRHSWDKDPNSLAPSSINGQMVAASCPASGATTPEEKRQSEVKLSIKEAQRMVKDMTMEQTGGDLSQTPRPLWENDPWASFTIGGACFGYALFGLVFSMLPPKLRKLTSWFGFTNMSRPLSLKLLSVAAQCSNDLHACISALILCVYYQSVLLVCGWESNEKELMKAMEQVLDTVEGYYPKSTLWIVMRSKLARMNRDTDSAIALLSQNASKDSSFRQAKSLLIFELGWNYLSADDFKNASQAFLDVKKCNNWSHSTYNFMAIGCLLSLPEEEQKSEQIQNQIKELAQELPAMIGKKRMLGEQLPSETFIQRKLGFYQYKFTRWCQQGRLNKENNHWWDCVRIGFQWEFSVFWNALSRMPEHTLRHLVATLSSFSPSPSPGYSKKTGPIKFQATDELDTMEEIVLRSLLLGLAYLAMGELKEASAHLEDAAARGAETDEIYAAAYANYALALCTLRSADANPDQSKAAWDLAFTKAETFLEEIFKRQEHYNMKSRLESRVSMLRSEMSVKKDIVSKITTGRK